MNFKTFTQIALVSLLIANPHAAQPSFLSQLSAGKKIGIGIGLIGIAAATITLYKRLQKWSVNVNVFGWRLFRNRLNGDESNSQLSMQYPSKQYAQTSEGTLQIKNFAGTVNVQGWDRNVVEIEACKKGSTQEALDRTHVETSHSGNTTYCETRVMEDANRFVTPDSARVSISENIASSNGNVSIIADGDISSLVVHNGQITINGVRIPSNGLRINNNLAALVHYTIKVPFKTSVVVKNLQGNILLHNIARAAELNTETGRIETDNCADVNAASANGNIELLNAYRTAQAATRAGNVTIHGANRSPRLNLVKAISGAGNLKIKNAETGNAQTSAGNISIWNGGRVRAHTSAGRVYRYA